MENATHLSIQLEKPEKPLHCIINVCTYVYIQTYSHTITINQLVTLLDNKLHVSSYCQFVMRLYMLAMSYVSNKKRNKLNLLK